MMTGIRHNTASLGAAPSRSSHRASMPLSGARGAASAGLTLLELIIACAILLVLATAVIPLTRVKVMRYREGELRQDLHDMRAAIDRYKDDSDKGLIQSPAGTEGYPPDLDTLVTGVDLTAAASTTSGLPQSNVTGATQSGTTQSSGSQSTGTGTPPPAHVRYLREIPMDPFTGDKDWGLRSVQDDPDATDWGGQDVFDVYSKSTGTALDGSKYSDW